MIKRVSIYISDIKVWESIKEAADRDGRSISNYLVRLHQATLQVRNVKKVIVPNEDGAFFNPMPKGGK